MLIVLLAVTCGIHSPCPQESLGQESVPGRVEQKKLRFSFRYAPWKDVLDWFATEAGYSLSLEAPPTGTFNYTDNRLYTPAESIDLLNSVLLVKGYTLIRRDRMLMLINLQDEIPPNLVSNIPLEELDERGEFELLSTTFQLARMTPEEAEEEVSKLIGPQGKVIVFSKARQVVVTETAGKLRMIRDMINAVEAPEEVGSASITKLPLEHISPDEALLVIRQIMGLEEDGFSSEDGTLMLSIDALGTKLIAKATPDTLAEIRDVLKLIDVPVEIGTEEAGISAAPQLNVYAVSNADPDAVLQVMQTLLAGLPDVRLSIDPQTSNLIALARPAQHATIQATLEQLQSQYDELEVIDLHYVDPATAKLAVESMFGIDPDSEEPQRGPRVDANVTTRQLLVRGAREEIERIRTLLEKMGEDGEGEGPTGGNIRMIPMSGSSAQALMERIRGVWPTIRGNKIKEVTPSATVNALQGFGRDSAEGDGESPPAREFPFRGPDVRRSPVETPTPAVPPFRPEGVGVGVRSTRVTFLAQADDGDGKVAEAGSANRGAVDRTQRLPEIVVAPGPGGLMIASDDLEALDAFEELVTALSDPVLFPDNDYTVFYLKFAKAESAAKLLNDLISGESGGGAAANSIADAAFGSLLDAAAGALDTSGPLQIIPDGRINALIVRGQAADVELVRQLLTVVDQKHSPEDVQTQAAPRLIPVFNTSASDVANVIKEIYAKRISGSDSGGGQGGQGGRRQGMEQLMAAMRGGRGGGGNLFGGGGQLGQTVEPDLTVGVDARSNSLIVSAPDPLFDEIKDLVEQLDEEATSANEVTKVVTVNKANPDAIQKALSSLFGAQVASSPNSQNTTNNSNANPQRQNQNDAAAQEAARRRAEFFNALRRGGGFGGRGGDRGGGGGGRGGQRGGNAGGRNNRGGGGRGGR